MATAVDYGYEEMDYGYGDAAPHQEPVVDYGYGDAQPDDVYGYGDQQGSEPSPPPQPKQPAAAVAGGGGGGESTTGIRRPKRRCSVTKFSLQTESPLNAAAVINDYRTGAAAGVGVVTPSPTNATEPEEPIKHSPPPPPSQRGVRRGVSRGMSTSSSMDFVADTSNNNDGNNNIIMESSSDHRPDVPGRKKSGLLRLLGRR